jgi:hypothetical protein
MRAAELESVEAELMTVATGWGWKVGVEWLTEEGVGAKRKRLLSMVLKDVSTQSPNRGGSISGADGRCGVILLVEW